MPVPPQLRIVLLLELNLINEVGRSCVYGQRGQKVRVSRDSFWKDVNRTPGVLNTIPGKKISKIFSPA